MRWEFKVRQRMGQFCRDGSSDGKLQPGWLEAPCWAHTGYLSGKEPLEGGCFEAASTVTIRGQCFTTSCSVQETYFLRIESKSFKGTERCLKQESKCEKKERCISLDLKLISECSHFIVLPVSSLTRQLNSCHSYEVGELCLLVEPLSHGPELFITFETRWGHSVVSERMV